MKKIDPLQDGISCIELVRTSGSDLDVVNGARVSYGKESKELIERDKKLILFLLKHKHTSPFEHTHLVYRIKTPISIARQWMRHRIGVSYNEISGRYSLITTDFYLPKEWRTPDPNNRQGSLPMQHENDAGLKAMYQKTINLAAKTYHDLLEAGICRELARGVLPQCVYTQFIFTCNLVSLFHFVHLRAAPGAQWEIQQYARGLINLAHPSFPISIHHWKQLNGFVDEDANIASQDNKNATTSSTST